MAEPLSDLDYVDENQLRDLGIEPVLVRIFCPWAVEYTGHDGQRSWAVADLATLTHGGCE
jgi:hypothetical protein